MYLFYYANYNNENYRCVVGKNYDPNDYPEDQRLSHWYYPDWANVLKRYRMEIFSGEKFCLKDYWNRTKNSYERPGNCKVIELMIQKLGGELCDDHSLSDYSVFDSMMIANSFSFYDQGRLHLVNKKYIIDAYCCLIKPNVRNYKPKIAIY